jgi:hypothetical protein
MEPLTAYRPANEIGLRSSMIATEEGDAFIPS